MYIQIMHDHQGSLFHKKYKQTNKQKQPCHLPALNIEQSLQDGMCKM